MLVQTFDASQRHSLHRGRPAGRHKVLCQPIRCGRRTCVEAFRHCCSPPVKISCVARLNRQTADAIVAKPTKATGTHVGHESTHLYSVALNLFVVLAAGLVSSLVCRRLRVSLLVGYLAAGGLLGEGGLGLIAGQQQEIEMIARLGVLMLLFAIGIELTIEELARMGRSFLVGGGVQMLVTAAVTTGVCVLWNMPLRAAVLVGWAVALSSTVLVFKALSEWGQANTPGGRAAVGVLLFQDVALVPLILLVPLLTGGEQRAGWPDAVLLAIKSALFVGAVWAGHVVVREVVVPALSRLRSTEIVVLFVMALLAGWCIAAHWAGLPMALGALAAGLVVSGTRLSAQIDALVLPYRETFAAVFFISVGTLLRPGVLWNEPLATAVCLAGVLVLKMAAATVALKLVGLSWKAAAGLGLGLAQLGEFSFVLLSEGVRAGVVSGADYNRVLLVAVGTLLLTPLLLRVGLRWVESESAAPLPPADEAAEELEHAVVIGIGPVGAQVASLLETRGVDVCLVDLSPINLYPFAQQGFRNVAGDATDPEVLRRAGLERADLCVVTVPDDRVAQQIVGAIRAMQPRCRVVVRCRYQANVSRLRQAGAELIISEESEAASALLALLQPLLAARISGSEN